MRPIISLNCCRHGRGRGSIWQALRDRGIGTCLQCVKFHLVSRCLLTSSQWEPCQRCQMQQWACGFAKASGIACWSCTWVKTLCIIKWATVTRPSMKTIHAWQPGKKVSKKMKDNLILKAWQRVEQVPSGTSWASVAGPSRSITSQYVSRY